MSLESGQIIQDKYRIVRLIGQGGMGEVYEGLNISIARRVAIKVLHATVASNEDVLRRFQREAQAAGRIGNDHILEVLDVGELPNGDKLMVMEYLDGEELSARIKRLGRLTPEQVAPLALQLLAGLQAAHDAGIVHRDLKPDNVFILREKAGHRDYVKIIDFGISKFSQLGDTQGRMTVTGAVMGTPYYMSPEQAKGDTARIDARSDVYAVGVILFEAVTGSVPFSGESFNQLMFQIVLSELTPARDIVPDLDPAFDAIISKAMAKEPEQRFQSAREMSAAIDHWIRGGAGATRPLGTDLPAPNTAANATAPQPARTVGNFSQSQPAAVRSSRGWLLAAGVAAAVVAVGGVAFALLSGPSESPDLESAASGEESAALSQSATPPVVAPIDSVADKPPAVVPEKRGDDAEPAQKPAALPATASSAQAAPPPPAPKPPPSKGATASPAPKRGDRPPAPPPPAKPPPKREKPPPKKQETDYGY